MRPAEGNGRPPTLFQVVHRAVEVTDPSGDLGVADLLGPVEDSDEPVTSHEDIETDLAELKGRVDPQDEDPAVMMAIDDATDDILRLAARAEYDGNPPDNVRAWLEERGVEI